MMNETASSDALDTTPTAAPATKKAKTVKKPASKTPAKKVAAPAAKKAAAKTPAKAVKGAAKKATTDKPAKAKKVVDPNISTKQPEDAVVLKALAKLKEPTLASQFSAGLGVHRRVIRAQLQRLAKDKANGFKMEKKDAHWMVTKKA